MHIVQDEPRRTSRLFVAELDRARCRAHASPAECDASGERRAGEHAAQGGM